MCVSPTMESVGLLLTGRDKVRIKEPFAFVQNSTLSKPVCVPHGHCTLGFWADTSAHALSALRGKGGVTHFCACGTGHTGLVVRPESEDACHSQLAARCTWRLVAFRASVPSHCAVSVLVMCLDGFAR